MQKHILVLFTGGTIGCEKEGEKIALGDNSPVRLFDYYREFGKGDVRFSYRTPFTMLSENSDGETIRRLCLAVKEALLEAVDGIIVTHGSDTLQYSGAALSFFLGKLSKSVILVSSNYVLSDKRANGFDNFTAAVDVICMNLNPDVYISYRNHDAVTRIYKANRCLPHGYNSDDLNCVGKPVMVFERNCNTSTVVETAMEKIMGEDNKEELEITSLPAPGKPDSPVLFLKIYPGMCFPKVHAETKVILLETYHSGTLPDHSIMKNWLDENIRQNIPVLICGTGSHDYYASCLGWKDKVHVLPEISPVAAYMKLWMLYEKYADDEGNLKDMTSFLKQMFTNISGEFPKHDV